jgi:D-aminopeptidase
MASQEAALDKLFAGYGGSDRPGCTVAIVHDGKTLLRKGYGMASVDLGVPNTPETVIRIGSQTKQLAVFLAFLLIKEGKLGYDDEVLKYHTDLPDYGVPVKISHVMTNVSGMREFLDMIALSGADARSPISADEVSKLMRGQPDLNFKPGDRLMYCNTGFRLLSEIVEKVGGESMEDLLRKRIFEPLGMANSRLMRLDDEIVPGLATHHLQQPDGSYKKGRWGVPVAGEGSAVSTVDDMLVWAANMVSDKPKVGTPEIFKKMQTPPKFNSGRTSIYAHGLQSAPWRGVHGIGHGGGVPGGRSGTYQFPEHKLAIAILGNVDNIAPYTLSRKIADIVLGDRLQPLPPAPKTADLDKLAGLYWDDARAEPMELVVENGELISRLGHKTPLWQLSPGTFVPMSGVHEQEFKPTDDGRGFKATDSGVAVSWRRIDGYNAPKGDLEQALGSYANAGLEATYTISNGGDRLILDMQGALGRKRMGLTPILKDVYVASALGPRQWGGDFQPVLHLVRDGAMVTGLNVSTDRNKKIRFARTS